MFTFTAIEQNLKSSDWPKEVIQQLLPVVPQLGQWGLAFLGGRIDAIDGKYSAQQIAEVLVLEPDWYGKLQSNAAPKIMEELLKIIAAKSEVQERALLAVILDIRSNHTVEQFLTDELSKIFDNIEVRYFRNLPVVEVSHLLEFRLNRIIDVADLQMEIKRYLYYRDSVQLDAPEIILFRTALESNAQLIGSKPKQIKEWIVDFLQGGSQVKERTVYNVAFYLTNNPALKLLEPQERLAIGEILKLYNWLLQPVTTAEEIDEYEQHRMQLNPSAPGAMPLEGQAGYDPKLVPPSVDSLKGGLPDPNTQANIGVKTIILSAAQGGRTGIVLDQTNIQMDDEQKRIADIQREHEVSIQKKLADLRARNKGKSI